jgi:hypothetical protein
MACYRDSSTFLYVDDVHTSQDTHLWTSTACYGYCFIYTLNMEPVYSSAMLVLAYQTAQLHIGEDSNLKSNIIRITYTCA